MESLSFSITCPQQSFVPKRALSEREQAIARMFQITFSDSSDSQQGIDPNELCFSAVYQNTCEGKWDKIREISSHLAGFRNQKQQTIYDVLIENHQQQIIQSLLNQSLAYSLSDGKYKQSLHDAVEKSEVAEVNQLLKYISIHEKDDKNATPLHRAILSKSLKAIPVLLQRGASLETRMPLSLPSSLVSSVQVSPIALAAACGNSEGFVMLLQERKNVNLKTHRVASIGNLLHVCIHYQQLKMLRFLLELPLFPVQEFLNDKDDQGKTPLMEAASQGNCEAIKLLKEKGANLEEIDHEGRTALHHAVAANHYPAVAELCELGSRLERRDNSFDAPIDIAKRQSLWSIVAFLGNKLVQECTDRTRLPNFAQTPPKNIVFQGGGPAGIIHLGAISAMKQENLFSSLERVAGTSAGAILALGVALGYTDQELTDFLTKTKLTDFLDSSIVANTIQTKASTQNSLMTIWNWFKTAKSLASMPIELYRSQGICEGETFRNWIEDIIYKKTNINFCTFGEFSELIIKQGKSFKHLHVVATAIGENPKMCTFSSENTEWRELVISDVIRASMSIPGVFRPHFLYFKKDGQRIKQEKHGQFIDGGLLGNLPDWIFDKKEYIRECQTDVEKNTIAHNRFTLALRLYSDTQLTPPLEQSARAHTVKDLVRNIIQLYYNAENHIRDERNPLSTYRIVSIKIPDGVGLLSFDIDQKKQQEMIKSGFSQMHEFINKQKQQLIPNNTNLTIPTSTQNKLPTQINQSTQTSPLTKTTKKRSTTTRKTTKENPTQKKRKPNSSKGKEEKTTTIE